jgi:hypothetical protein
LIHGTSKRVIVLGIDSHFRVSEVICWCSLRDRIWCVGGAVSLRMNDIESFMTSYNLRILYLFYRAI